MSNIGTVLKAEITRLSQKSVRANLRPIQQASSSHRSQLAALKKQVQQLERQVNALQRGIKKALPTPKADEGTKVRFTAKGLSSLRSRLGLSAAEFGQLLQVSAQTIYKWENKKASPRKAQIPAIAGLRKIGKREIKARLETLKASG